MKKIVKLAFIFFAVVIVSLPVIWINWQNIFGTNRPIENLKAVYQIEYQDKQISSTKDVYGEKYYVVPKGKLETFIGLMNKKGYELINNDALNNKILLKKDNGSYSVSYTPFMRKYTKIESPE